MSWREEGKKILSLITSQGFVFWLISDERDDVAAPVLLLLWVLFFFCSFVLIFPLLFVFFLYCVCFFLFGVCFFVFCFAICLQFSCYFSLLF